MGIKKLIRILRRTGEYEPSRGGSDAADVQIINDTKVDSLVKGAVEIAIADRSVHTLANQKLLKVELIESKVANGASLPPSDEVLITDQFQSEFCLNEPGQPHRARAASFRRSSVLSKLASNEVSGLKSEVVGAPATFNPTIRRKSCPDAALIDAARSSHPSESIPILTSRTTLRPRPKSMVYPTPKIRPSSRIIQSRSRSPCPSLETIDAGGVVNLSANVQKHIDQYMAEPPVSAARLVPATRPKMLSSLSVDEFKPRASNGRRMSCPTVDATQVAQLVACEGSPNIQSPFLNNGEKLLRTNTGSAKPRRIDVQKPVEQNRRRPLSEVGRRPSCPSKIRDRARKTVANKSRLGVKSSLKEAEHGMSQELDMTTDESADQFSICKNVSRSTVSSDADMFRRPTHRRRVNFSEGHMVHLTFSSNDYDRSKAIQREEDKQSIMTVYRELMKYKITEMIVHPSSVKHTNHHLSKRDAAAYNMMMGTIQAIISEYAE